MRPKRWFYTEPLRIQPLFRRRQVDQDLDDEFHDNTKRKAAEYITLGMSPEEARCPALSEFGGVEQPKEKCRDAHNVNCFYDLARDAEYTVRQLPKHPAFAALSILTLALGIGANIAMFTVIDSVSIRPLPGVGFRASALRLRFCAATV